MNCIVQNLWSLRALSLLAAQAAVGLALITAICRHYKTTDLDKIDSMKG
jgi:NADH:ubiquinone oxidoreductase subunit K